jgi:hypothetical protein
LLMNEDEHIWSDIFDELDKNLYFVYIVLIYHKDVRKMTWFYSYQNALQCDLLTKFMFVRLRNEC